MKTVHFIYLFIWSDTLTDFSFPSSQIYKYYALLASLPQLACLAYLCVQFPLLFIKGPNTDEVRTKYHLSLDET